MQGGWHETSMPRLLERRRERLSRRSSSADAGRAVVVHNLQQRPNDLQVVRPIRVFPMRHSRAHFHVVVREELVGLGPVETLFSG